MEKLWLTLALAALVAGCTHDRGGREQQTYRGTGTGWGTTATRGGGTTATTEPVGGATNYPGFNTVPSTTMPAPSTPLPRR